jgi:hypothetical protein
MLEFSNPRGSADTRVDGYGLSLWRGYLPMRHALASNVRLQDDEDDLDEFEDDEDLERDEFDEDDEENDDEGDDEGGWQL